MADELNRALKALTVSNLKSVADKAGIDVSSCKSKNDYVRTLSESPLTEEKLKALLFGESESEEVREDEMKSVAKDLKDISERPSEGREVPEDEDVDIERSIDKALLLRPLFFEIDTATEHTWNRMILGDFAEAVRLNIESRSEAMERLTTFHLYSAALSIRAAETLLRDMRGLDGKMTSEIKTALAEAKMAFIHGPPKRRESAVHEIETLTMKAVEAYLSQTYEAEQELRSKLEEYASFGVRTQVSYELLDLAANAKRSYDLAQYSDMLEKAEIQAHREKESRLKDIDDAFEQVRTAIEAAKEAGADTADGEASLRDARKAFKTNDFKAAAELLADIERAVDLAHLDKVRSNGAVEAREIAEITTSIREAEPDLEEAAMYGLDVQDGLLFVRQTKTALEQRDVVTASKYSRRVRKLARSMEKDIKRLRTEKGILSHVEGAKCGECGKESLYAFPDGRTKCDDCGHKFTTGPGRATVAAAPATRQLKSGPQSKGVLNTRKRRNLLSKK